MCDILISMCDIVHILNFSRFQTIVIQFLWEFFFNFNVLIY